MATDAIVPAAPSTAFDPNTLEGSVRQQWRMTGEIPAPKPEAASTPAKEPSDGEQSPESAAAPEAAHKTQENQPEKRDDAESRIKKLLAENKRLKAQVASPTQADSSPAKVTVAEPAKPVEVTAPVRPKLEDFANKTQGEYWQAMAEYHEKDADYRVNVGIQRYEQQRVQREQQAKMNEEVTEARKRYSDFDSIAGPAVHTIFSDQAISPIVKQALERSRNLTDILYVIGGDKAAMDDFVGKSKSDPIAAIELLVTLRGLVDKELSKGKAKVEKPPEPRVTGVAPPPKEVNARSTPEVDPVKAALESDDFDRYKEAANARDLARIKAGRR